MSCAEVMYHPQPYGAPQYLPNPVAAATCPTAYYHPATQPGQQVSQRPGSLPGAGARGTRSIGVELWATAPPGKGGAPDALELGLAGAPASRQTWPGEGTNGQVAGRGVHVSLFLPGCGPP